MSPERRGAAAIVGLLLLGSGLLFISLPPIDQEEQESLPLPVGEAISGTLRGGERHAYGFSVEPGQAFRVTVDPKRGDFALALRDPFRSDQLLIDTRNGLRGLETLYAVANAPGQYRFEVRSLAPAGRNQSYTLKVDPPRPIEPEDRLRQAAMAAFSRGERLFGSAKGAALHEVTYEYGKALDLWQKAEEHERVMATRYRLGLTLEKLWQLKEAREFFSPALEQARSRRNRLAEALLLDRIGRTFPGNQAGTWYRQSLTLFQQERFRPGEADLLNNLGLVYIRGGDFPEGFRYVNKGLDIWRELGGVREEVYILQNLGEKYIDLSEPEHALDQFEMALKISAGNDELEARALGGMGAAHSEMGQGDKAVQELTRAAELWRGLGDRFWEAISLVRLGEAYARLDQLDEAREKMEEALALSSREPRDDFVRAIVLGNLGHVLDLQSREKEAIARFQQARSLFEAQGDHGSVAKVLRGQTEAALDLGDLDTAHAAVKNAITLVEGLRSPFPTDFSLRRHLYDLYIEILMGLHRREPDGRHAAEAFNAAEAARSRSLLDDVKALEVDVQSDDSDLQEKAGLEARLVRLEMQGWALPQGRLNEEVDRQIRVVEAQLRSVRTRLERRGLPGSPRPLTLPEVQRSLDPDTLLLVYSLGPRRSWLWEVTRDRFVTHELPFKRSEIEEQARKVHRLLSRSVHREWRAWAPALRELSKTLLSPVAGRMNERQLLISPDGELSLTPFAALLDPRTLKKRPVEPGTAPGAPRFLALDHQLATITSISVVVATREALSGRAPAKEGIAVLAAPDFEGTDLPPLEHALEEGQAIVRLAPPGRSFLTEGRQASRAAAIDPRLGFYNYLHFATHGRLRDRPDLSGIALSDGFLRAFEIYDLDLSCELVVLSACDTAVGAERGGLVRAFLQAGSRRVMATLWKVSDRSTPRLMEGFYHGLLQQGMTPSAALQQAQVQMLGTRWKAPHYWAGFVLQGEWR